MQFKTDVLIVGAGPAGLAAARRARERGLSVILIDASPGGIGGRAGTMVLCPTRGSYSAIRPFTTLEPSWRHRVIDGCKLERNESSGFQSNMGMAASDDCSLYRGLFTTYESPPFSLCSKYDGWHAVPLYITSWVIELHRCSLLASLVAISDAPAEIPSSVYRKCVERYISLIKAERDDHNSNEGRFAIGANERVKYQGSFAPGDGIRVMASVLSPTRHSAEIATMLDIIEATDLARFACRKSARRVVAKEFGARTVAVLSTNYMDVLSVAADVSGIDRLPFVEDIQRVFREGKGSECQMSEAVARVWSEWKGLFEEESPFSSGCIARIRCTNLPKGGPIDAKFLMSGSGPAATVFEHLLNWILDTEDPGVAAATGVEAREIVDENERLVVKCITAKSTLAISAQEVVLALPHGVVSNAVVAYEGVEDVARSIQLYPSDLCEHGSNNPNVTINHMSSTTKPLSSVVTAIRSVQQSNRHEQHFAAVFSFGKEPWIDRHTQESLFVPVAWSDGKRVQWGSETTFSFHAGPDVCFCFVRNDAASLWMAVCALRSDIALTGDIPSWRKTIKSRLALVFPGRENYGDWMLVGTAGNYPFRDSMHLSTRQLSLTADYDEEGLAYHSLPVGKSQRKVLLCGEMFGHENIKGTLLAALRSGLAVANQLSAEDLPGATAGVTGHGTSAHHRSLEQFRNHAPEWEADGFEKFFGHILSKSEQSSSDEVSGS